MHILDRFHSGRLFLSVSVAGLLVLCSVLGASACNGGRAVAGTASPPNPDAFLKIGNRKQLLVDDYVVAERQSLTRELGTVQKANGGKPIFTGGRFYGTVLYDGGRFKMWYRRHDRGFEYAESHDGLHFEKKASVTGINFAGDYTLAVIIDPHETDPAHRYKASYDGPGMAAAIAHSPDGITWIPYNDGKAVTRRAADTYNQIVWDGAASLYRLFTRTDFGAAGRATEIRGTRAMSNPDVKRNPAGWTEGRSWKFDREGPEEHKRRQIYCVTDWIYEGVHIALMAVYEWPGDASEGPADLQKRHERDVMNFYIATSRDADHWDLTWVYAGRPMIPRGPDGAFDKDLLLAASEIVTRDDQHWLYYCGGNERHGSDNISYPRDLFIGLATLRLDGFVCLAAGERPGLLVTKLFVLEGGALALNVDASAGTCRVEIRTAAGEPISGFALCDAEPLERVDGLRLMPRWKMKPDLRALRGQPLRLAFELTGAKLYAFEVIP